MTQDEHIKAATAAAERRLAIAYAVESEDEEFLSELNPAGSFDELAGPFCGCDTCVIREVLDAAWPHLLAAAKPHLHAL